MPARIFDSSIRSFRSDICVNPHGHRRPLISIVIDAKIGFAKYDNWIIETFLRNASRRFFFFPRLKLQNGHYRVSDLTLTFRAGIGDWVADPPRVNLHAEIRRSPKQGSVFPRRILGKVRPEGTAKPNFLFRDGSSTTWSGRPSGDNEPKVTTTGVVSPLLLSPACPGGVRRRLTSVSVIHRST